MKKRKVKFEEITNLKELRMVGSKAIPCPSCRNDLEVVSNGFFGGELFFCEKEEKIFAITLREITHQADEEYLQQCRDEILIEDVKFKINQDTVKQVSELLKKLT